MSPLFLLPLALATQPPSFTVDSDGDTVVDASDRCPWEDDRVDLDGNGTPDCDETLMPTWGADTLADTLSWEHGMGLAAGFDATADANGYAPSGSLYAATYGLSSPVCVPVNDAYEYQLYASVNTGAGRDAYAVLGLTESDQDACGSSMTTQVTVDQAPMPPSGWFVLGGSYRPSPGTRWVRLWVGLSEHSRVDNVLFATDDAPSWGSDDPN